jgi:hypothetical protein
LLFVYAAVGLERAVRVGWWVDTVRAFGGWWWRRLFGRKELRKYDRDWEEK